MLERVRVGVDLVGADRFPAGLRGDRRVDLEHVAEAEPLLDGVLVPRELVDRARRAACADRPREVAVDLEVPPDPAAVAARPGEHAVGPPDLDRDEVGLAVDLREEARRLARRDLDAPVPDDARTDDAVDVGEEARLRVVEGLGTERARQLGPEHEAGDEKDGGARDQEDAQQREGALERSSVPRLRGRPQVQGESSRDYRQRPSVP